MKALSHFAEPYSPQGNIDARAAARAIGRPQMDPWDVFLRETLQNSWDARLAAAGPITYSADGFMPNKAQRKLLRDTVFRDRVPGSDLEDFLSDPQIQSALVVTDIGTKGLGGPTRADLVTSEPTDFVDFVRNVGRAVEKTVGGGTYGFGKGILWQMSYCSTVLIYSKSTFEGEAVSRFVAMGHTDPFDEGESRFTGRHWWGREDSETKIEPIVGTDADKLAEALGMDRLASQDSGTAVMVLGPVTSDAAETLDEIVERLARAALWWSWPHMVDQTIEFEFTCEGEEVPVTLPADDPIIRHFADAYVRTASIEQSTAEWPWRQEVLRSLRPSMRLGAMVWRQVSTEELEPASGSLVDIRSNIALMRRPRFVVRYLPVRDDPHGLGTVGVFVADGSLDEVFASAEPVAHDDWAPANMRLEKGRTNPVKRALELLRQTFVRSAVQVPAADADGRRQSGIVHLATQIGDLVSGVGDAAVIDRPKAGPGGSPKALSVRVVGRPRLVPRDGEASAIFEIGARVPSSVKLPVRVLADPYVLTEAGRDTDPGLDQPAVLEWTADPTVGESSRDVFLIQASGEHTFQLHVSVPPDSAVALSLRASEEGEAS